VPVCPVRVRRLLDYSQIRAVLRFTFCRFNLPEVISYST
jgi:hypothetical protein